MNFFLVLFALFVALLLAHVSLFWQCFIIIALLLLGRVIVQFAGYYGYYHGRKDGRDKCNGFETKYEDEFNYEEFSEFMEEHDIE